MTALLDNTCDLDVRHEQAAPDRLNALTSLRFFAATFIVVFHTLAPFGLDTWHIMEDGKLAMRQCVSFFFVLSGFILTRVHPQLDGLRPTLAFYRARVARIWPVHLLCLVLFALAGPLHIQVEDWPRQLASIFLVQSWFPAKRLSAVLNPPSWSLSTEAFFYLSFPWLLIGMRRRPMVPIAIAMFALAAMVAIAEAGLLIPSLSTTRLGCIAHDYLDGLLYLNPLSRLLEFVAGMYLACIIDKSSARSFLARHLTLLGWISLVLVAICIASPLWLATINAKALAPLCLWLSSCGGVFPYVLLTAVFASPGALSKTVSSKLLVRLGNMSYAMYLVHTPLMYFFYFHVPQWQALPPWLGYIVFWIVLLALSDLIYACFETPLRHCILGRHPQPLRLPPTLLAAAEISVVTMALLFVGVCLHNFRLAPSSQVQSLRSASPQELQGVTFAGRLKLEGVRLQQEKPGSYLLQLAWSSLRPQWLSNTVAIHLIDHRDRISDTLDYYQDKAGLPMFTGDQWCDSIHIDSKKLIDAKALAIAIYPKGCVDALLAIDRGPRDWNNKRLRIPLAALGIAR